MLLLALLVGLSGATVLTAVAGASRTTTAYDRLLVHSRASHVLLGIDPGVDGPPFSEIEALPMVERLGEVSYMFMAFEAQGPADLVVPFAAGDEDQYQTVDRGKLIAGRRPIPSDPSEVAVSPEAARRLRWRPGTRLDAQVASMQDIQDAVSGKPFFPLDGPHVSFVVTGVLRQPTDLIALPDEQSVVYLGGAQTVYLTPAFYERYVEPILGSSAGATVVLRNGMADLDEFRAAVARLPRGDRVEIEPNTTMGREVKRATGVQATALLIFAALTAIAAVLIVGQGIARHVFLRAGDHATMRALGMTRAQLVGVSLVHPMLIAIIGASIAVGLAVVGSSLMPFGLARQAEPTPGIDINVAVLAIGGAVVALLVLARASLAAWQAARAASTTSDRVVPDPRARPSLAAAALAATGAPPTAVTGVRLALEPGKGRSAVPVRSSLAGVVVAVAALITAFGFSTSLDHLATTPSLYGWNWDVIVGNPNNEDTSTDAIPRLASDRAIERFSAATSGAEDVSVDGEFARALGVDATHGEVFPVMTAGAPPRAAGEVALGARLAQRLDRRIGDTVTLAAGTRTMTARVTGIAVRGGDQTTGTTAGGAPGEGILLTLDGLRRLHPGAPVVVYLVRFADGVGRPAAIAGLERAFERQVLRPIRPSAIENVLRIKWIPHALAAVLAVLGLATLAHTLVTSVQRRRREIAILKTIGFVRPQVSGAVAWQSSATAILALVVGVPIGVTCAGWAWRIVATQIGVTAEPVVPLGPITAGVAITLVVANLIAAWPGIVAARTAAAPLLRPE